MHILSMVVGIILVLALVSGMTGSGTRETRSDTRQPLNDKRAGTKFTEGTRRTVPPSHADASTGGRRTKDAFAVVAGLLVIAITMIGLVAWRMSGYGACRDVGHSAFYCILQDPTDPN